MSGSTDNEGARDLSDCAIQRRSADPESQLGSQVHRSFFYKDRDSKLFSNKIEGGYMNYEVPLSVDKAKTWRKNNYKPKVEILLEFFYGWNGGVKLKLIRLDVE